MKRLFIILLSSIIISSIGCGKDMVSNNKRNSLMALLYALSRVQVVPSNINISVSPSRTSGVAPLSVFFDATGTTGLADSGFFSNNAAYMDATFSWDFDADNADPDGKYEKASGFVAAHVFEHPGTYRVRLDVYDAAGRAASQDITVTVTEFSGTTYYAAADNTYASDSNPGTIDRPFLTPAYALTGPHMQSNTRILFRRGDIFYTPFFRVENNNGPVIVDSYYDDGSVSGHASASADKPIIYSTEADNSYSACSVDANDWRIMNIALRSGGSSYTVGTRYPSGIDFGGGSQNNLKYRCTEYSLGQLPMKMCGRYNTIAECDFHTFGLGAMSSDDWGYNDHNAIIGNYIHDKTDDVHGHILRLQSGSNMYIAHNTSTRIGHITYDAWTTRGNSSNIVYYQNRIEGWVTYAAPEVVDYYDQRVHHIMYDSNLLIGPFYDTGVDSTGDSTLAVRIRAKDIAFRNNILYNYGSGFLIEDDSVVGYSRRIKVYNNTFICNIANGVCRMFLVESACANLYFMNNVMLDAAGSDPVYRAFMNISEGSTFNGESDNNMFYGNSWGADPYLFSGTTLAAWQSSSGNDLHSLIADPLLVSTDNNNTDFCKPQAGSPVIDAGEFTPAALDYYGNLRDGSRDIGACEYH